MTRAARIATVGLALAALVACGKGGDEPAAGPPPGRFDTAAGSATGKKRAVTVEELCDVRPAAGAAAPILRWPALSGATPAGSGPRWINLWATWCAPCLEEVPLIQAFHRDRAAAGAAFDLAFVSVDDSDEVLAAHRARSPAAPPGPRLARAADLPGFLRSVGLDEAAPIPVHIFTGPAGDVRCVRAGALRATDLDAVGQLLR